MKFEIYNEPTPKEEPTFRLKLSKQTDGDVCLSAITADGGNWTLLLISTNGELYLASGIDKNTGLVLDKKGRLKVHK